MPRPLSIALIAVFCLGVTAMAEDKPSPAVKRILDKAVGKVRANRQEFDKANKKPLDEARAELQELVTKLNKDGKTKEAIDTLKQVETLEADVMKLANAPAPGPVPVPQKPLLERMAGKWTHPNIPHFFDFSPNGKANIVKKSGELDNDGALRQLSDVQVEARWRAGWFSRYQMIDPDTIVERSYRPDGSENGEGTILLRMK